MLTSVPFTPTYGLLSPLIVYKDMEMNLVELVALVDPKTGDWHVCVCVMVI